MKQTIFTLFAGAFLCVGLLASCRGKVTISGENGTDTLEFNTDSIKQVNINVQVGNKTADDAVTDEEAIAFIEEFYQPHEDGNIYWDEKTLKQYLSESVLKQLRDNYLFDDEESVPAEERYANWELLTTDPVGDMDLLNVSKAEFTGDGRYEKRFTIAHWSDHSIQQTSSLFYTVERIDGKLKITKVEDNI